MVKLEDIKPDVRLRGLIPSQTVSVVAVARHGDDVLEVTYRTEEGDTGTHLLYRDDESRIEMDTAGGGWAFDGDGSLLRLVYEARRIRLGYLFDPFLAVHTSAIEPLPHQITAVYGEMLPRQPLRFLLADDPGAGKTIMAGLLIKELRVRGDVRRCLICAPGSLVEQWQDEMQRKFGLGFEIITRERIETAKTGNPFAEHDLVIGRLDHMARNENVQARAAAVEWDLVVCDEAHKMSAHYYGKKVEETKRYQLGRRLRECTRHFLLLTATPHSGKEDDFQLFLALLDPERFEGRRRDAAVPADAGDIMRRMMKEDLCKFDGTRLFPERRAYTVQYELSDAERELYEAVTAYVTEEMNRADRLAQEGQGRRGNNVGFALTILQRRLASSPEAIYRSLENRRKRLEDRLRKLWQQGATQAALVQETDDPRAYSADVDYDADEFYDRPEDEFIREEDEVVDRATAARTVEELEREIGVLRGLEEEARHVRNAGTDRKWEELSAVLQTDERMFGDGRREKLIIFTEHRATLDYLRRRIEALLGRAEAVVVIHGSLNRDTRRAHQERFINDPDVCILVATDAAGEGVNLQRAHLVVNYDLPWNPNRIEQRFGRVHRIGQTEVCHMWNLVASETREGAVYHRLLLKLETMAASYQGKLFDVLGQLFEGAPLRELLIEAIRYGDRPEVRAALQQKVEAPFDPQRLRQLLEERALTAETMSPADVERVREEMARAEARKLQPHFIRSFFQEAFARLGGQMRERERGRYEITRVPAPVREWAHQHYPGPPMLDRYERICFEKEQVERPGHPLAALIGPGHVLLDTVVEMTLEQHHELFRRGAVLVDPADRSAEPRILVCLEHTISDGHRAPDGSQHVASRRLEFVEVRQDGGLVNAGCAPHLDYRPATPEEVGLLGDLLGDATLTSGFEDKARSYAIAHLIPQHLDEVRRRVEHQAERTLAAVRQRLAVEIAHWERRADELRSQELAGKGDDRLNSEMARRRAEELKSRLKTREEELERDRALAPRAPVVLGAALVVPAALLAGRQQEAAETPPIHARETAEVERIAMEAVMQAERQLGFKPRDVSDENRGYDVESDPGEGRELRFIEVKGRVAGADTVTITRNEILTAFNVPDGFILAIVLVQDGQAVDVRYLRRPFEKEPEFAVTSVNYKLSELLTKSEVPS